MILSINFKMGRQTFAAALLAVQIAASFSLPQQKLGSIAANIQDADSLIMGEGLVHADLKIKPSIHIADELENPNYTAYSGQSFEGSAKSGNDPVDFESEDDELNEPPKSTEDTSVSSSNKRTVLRLPSGGAVNVASSNPIYITIPIYITKSDGQPLRLSVGGQEVPVGPRPGPKTTITEPLSPTSQFNRLLKHDPIQLKRTKSSKRKSSKKKKLRHTSARLSPSKSHSSTHKSRRKHYDAADGQSAYYRFYF